MKTHRRPSSKVTGVWVAAFLFGSASDRAGGAQRLPHSLAMTLLANRSGNWKVTMALVVRAIREPLVTTGGGLLYGAYLRPPAQRRGLGGLGGVRADRPLAGAPDTS